MNWLALGLEALLLAPVFALFGLAFGAGDRFGVVLPVWPGAAAVGGAVLTDSVADGVGLEPLAAAMFIVPGVFAAAYGLGLLLTSRPDIVSDSARHSAAAVLVAVAALALVVLWRGDGPLPVLSEQEPSLTILGGPTISRGFLVSGALGLVALAGLGVILQLRPVRVRLAVLGRRPELLTSSGHDQRQVSALFGRR